MPEGLREAFRKSPALAEAQRPTALTLSAIAVADKMHSLIIGRRGAASQSAAAWAGGKAHGVGVGPDRRRRLGRSNRPDGAGRLVAAKGTCRRAAGALPAAARGALGGADRSRRLSVVAAVARQRHRRNFMARRRSGHFVERASQTTAKPPAKRRPRKRVVSCSYCTVYGSSF
jgi:hypothetical protein